MSTDLATRYHHRRPLNRAFYDGIAARLAPRGEPATRVRLPAEGATVRVEAGDVVTLRLLTGPQIVHLFAWNPDDPDERIWPHETSGIEDAFLRPYSRIWGMMARFRPLLTLVEDSVRTVDRPGELVGRHHFVLGGFETPFAWRAGGGTAGVTSSWERMRALVQTAGGEPSAYRDHVSLFQKVAVDPATQRFHLMRSDAEAEDRVSLFAEQTLLIALVPSEYRAGGLPAAECRGGMGEVAVEVHRLGIEPLGWPYSEVPYPDLSSYVDTNARRV